MFHYSAMFELIVRVYQISYYNAYNSFNHLSQGSQESAATSLLEYILMGISEGTGTNQLIPIMKR